MLVGEYLTNRMMIRLGHRFPMVDATTFLPAPLAPATIVVFLHEYLHYLQNISTVSGFQDFCIELELWESFRETVRGTQSSGSAILSEDKRQLIRAHSSLLGMTRGGAKPREGLFDEASSFRIRSITEERIPLATALGTTEGRRLILEGDIQIPGSDSSQTATFLLGNYAIYEGLASLLEERVAAQVGLPPTPGPYFPYKVLRALADYAAPEICDLDLIKLAMLALQGCEPATSLLRYLQAWGRNTGSTSERTEKIIEMALPVIRQTIQDILENEIDELLRRFTDKGHFGSGIAIVLQSFRECLSRRLQEPFFDVLPCFQEDANGTAALIQQHQPCLLLQEGVAVDDEDAGQRDALIAFDANQRPATNPEEPLSVLHAAFDWMRRHLDTTLSFRPTEQTDLATCPFYTCCPLELRRFERDVCKFKPWLALDWKDWPPGKSCWYANGVRASTLPFDEGLEKPPT